MSFFFVQFIFCLKTSINWIQVRKRNRKPFPQTKYMNTDPIADYLTRIRNASAARKKMVEIPASKVKRAMTEILFEQGYITNFKFEEDNKQGIIKIALKYNNSTKVPAITKLQRASRPGLRKYSSATDMPRVLNGLGIAIVSTSKGVITGKQAQKENVGGEVLAYVY